MAYTSTKTTTPPYPISPENKTRCSPSAPGLSRQQHQPLTARLPPPEHLALAELSRLARSPLYEGRAEEAEREKQEQLKEQREGKGHWKDELASDSESIVKADRNDMKNTQATISELQKEAAKQAEKEKKEGKQ
ncbi:hypothetical protein D0867_05976 [Hortaea werneckii]|uniref:Uncharacterized protein n=1 Tax=Hortaea werneckii TaxID=91943 RepID=A0A3M6ZR23_HORWE|nr:hypothetical protein D0867_05976 [Hortaea werneckii]